MAARRYERGEFFRRIHLSSLERRNDEGEDEGNKENIERIPTSGEGLSEFAAINNTTSTSTEACSNALHLPDHSIAKGPQGKRKGSDEPKAAKKAKKNKTWTADQVETLLNYLKDYKTKCDFNGVDFEADLTSMYREIHRCMAVDFPGEFGPEVATESSKPVKSMTDKETYKKQQNIEKDGINFMTISGFKTFQPVWFIIPFGIYHNE